MLPHEEDLDAEKIHVQDPSAIILLCGGAVSPLNETTPLSLRDAFLKILDLRVINDRELIKAEDVTKQYDFFDNYKDILDFETDLAQIVQLIILFCESEGSLAELGAFAMIPDIRTKLFVVVRDKHWAEPSFIKLGPLRRIEREIGRNAIQVVGDADVGLVGNSAAKVDKNVLKSLLERPLEQRLTLIESESRREPTTFSPDRTGHVIKLIVGLIQEYGALTLEEISKVLPKFRVNRKPEEIRSYLHCAKVIRWIREVSRGSDDYYLPWKLERNAATFHAAKDAKEKKKDRRRLLIRQHWQSTDFPRFRAIVQEVGELQGLETGGLLGE